MIEETIAAKAAIEAAEIQKWGAIWAALIGGLALALGVFVSWRTSLHLQQVARIAETRKNVYLELVEAYSDMMTAFNMLLFDIDKNWPIQIQKILEFGKKVDKATFICETETKVKIFKFLKSFEETFNVLQKEMRPLKELADELKSLSMEHEKIMHRFEEAAKRLELIKIEDPDQQKIEYILSYFDEQLRHSKMHIPLITTKEDELNAQIKLIRPFIDDLIDSLNKSVLPITHLLRKELGAKTNIELDLKVHSEFN